MIKEFPLNNVKHKLFDKLFAVKNGFAVFSLITGKKKKKSVSWLLTWK